MLFTVYQRVIIDVLQTKYMIKVKKVIFMLIIKVFFILITIMISITIMIEFENFNRKYKVFN